MKKLFVCLCALILPAACSTGIQLSKYAPQDQPRGDFTFCHGYSCTYQEQTGFTDREWRSIQKIFKPAARAPAQERTKIAGAIARMEQLIGAKTGTSGDLGQASSIKQDDGQMDCLDETVNTSRYLGFLYTAGLLKFHQVAHPVHRGYFIDGRWPHNTAVIEEIQSGDRYVVDSFYRPNGQEPYILPVKDWLAGWKPAGATQ